MRKTKNLIILIIFVFFIFSLYISNMKKVYCSDGEWKRIISDIYGGYINYFTINPTDSKTMYVITNNGIFISKDSGVSWEYLGLSEYIINSITIDNKNSNLIYVSTDGEGILKSVDGGKNWEKMNDGLTISNIDNVYIDPKDNNFIYAISWGGVYKSENKGKNWKKINEGLKSLRINKLVIDPLNTNILYLATYGGVYKSINQGENWLEINNGIKDLVINDIDINKKDTNFLIIGTSSGIYITNNNGTNWEFKENILSDINVNVVKVDINGILYVGTLGNGVYKSIDFGENFIEINDNLGDLRIKDLYIDNINQKILYTFTLGGEIYKFFPILKIETKVGEGGIINPQGIINVKFGESQKFNITPFKGYKIKDVIIDGKSYGEINIYTFEYVVDNHIIEVKFLKQIILELQIGNNIMYVNDIPKEIDVPPTIIEGRTLLPIRWVAEPLGASIGWDANEKKVTVSLKDTIIELWIGKNVARVNGVDTPIDPNNPKVVPMIIQGRTMLPVRFVAENLGSLVNWDPITKKVTIIYPK